MIKKPDYSAKIVVVGSSNVGKTNIISRICSDQFRATTNATVGLDMLKKYYKNQKNQEIELCFWDTAGQQAYRTLIRHYFKGCDAIIYVYSSDSKKSLDDLQFWMNQADCHIDKKVSSNLIEILLCNKIDLESGKVVGRSEGQMLRDKINEDISASISSDTKRSVYFFEISAKTGENIDFVLNFLNEKVSEKKERDDPIGKRPIYLSDTQSRLSLQSCEDSRQNKSRRQKCC